MNNPLEKLNTTVTAKLSESERASMGADFNTYMDEHPIAAPVRSPYHFAFPGAAFAFLFLLIVLPTGYAAEQSLPGDALYGIKTRAEDAFVGLASFSDESEAKAHVALVDRRLSEAELLIARGEDTGADLSLLADEVAQSAETISDLVETSTAEDEALIDAGEALEARLGAHHRIVDVLSENMPSEAVTEFTDEMTLIEHDTSEATDEAEDRGTGISYEDTEAEATTALTTLKEALSGSDVAAALPSEAAALLVEAERLYAEALTADGVAAIDLMELSGDAAREALLVLEAGERLPE